MVEFSLSAYIHDRAKKRIQKKKNYLRQRAKLVDRLIKDGFVMHETHKLTIIEHLSPVCGYRYAYLKCPTCAAKCRKFYLFNEVFQCAKCSHYSYNTIAHKITRLFLYKQKIFKKRNLPKLSHKIAANHLKAIKRSIKKK